MEKELENIFQYAASLDQAGKMKNTILCNEREIFIVNFDKTILLSFVLPKVCPEFKEKIVFDANDYDSSNFYVEGGSVVFKTTADGYVRKKKCGSNKSLDFDSISTMYYRYSRKKTTSIFTLRREIMGLLQDDLSHVEIHYDNGLKVIQRDIFSGTVIEITKDKAGLDLIDVDKLAPFSPMGLRTVDLDALFSYDRELTFSFVPEMNYFIVKGKITGLTGILSWCLFDEMGDFKVVQ